MSFLKFAGQVFDAMALGRQEDDEVIQQVGTFIDEAVVRAVAGLDDRFHGFFAHLLCHLVDAGAEEAGGVGTFGHFFVASADEVLQGLEKEDRLFIFLAPAGVRARVADRPLGVYLDEQGVVVAILLDGDNVQEISAFLAFGPKAVPRAAEEGHLAALHGAAIRFLVHKAQHQHFGRVGILYDGGNKPVHFIEVQIHVFLHI